MIWFDDDIEGGRKTSHPCDRHEEEHSKLFERLRVGGQATECSLFSAKEVRKTDLFAADVDKNASLQRKETSMQLLWARQTMSNCHCFYKTHCQSEFRKWCPNILQNFSSIINPMLKLPGSFWVAFHLFLEIFFVQKVCICFLHQVEMFPFFSFNSVCYTAFCLMTLLTQATTSNCWLQFSSDILFLDSDT